MGFIEGVVNFFMYVKFYNYFNDIGVCIFKEVIILIDWEIIYVYLF